MRKLTLILTLLFITTSAFCQRPWIKSAWPGVGSNPKLALATTTLIAYDTILASSYNHGEFWQVESEINGTVRGVMDFPVVSAALAFTQQNSGDTVYGYFTQDGTNWSRFDTLDIGNRLVVDVGSAGSNYLLATNTNTIVKVGLAGTTEIVVSEEPSAVISDFVSTSSAMAVLTSQGVRVSTDQGQSWKDVSADAGIPQGVQIYELINVGGTVFASSGFGVLQLDFTNATWKQVGKWDVGMGVPVVNAVAGDMTVLIAITTVGNRNQMFRLSTTDTLWVESAFPLPGTEPAVMKNSLIADAGWAVTNHAPVETDSAGIYRFDLNDFTSVDHDPVLAQIRIVATQYGLRIDDAPSLPVHLNICNLIAATLEDRDITQGANSIELQPDINGLLGVTLTLANGRMVRRMVIR